MIWSKFTPTKAFALALGLAIYAAPTVHAGNLDDGFIKGGAAAQIRDYLLENGFKNVGVLRFEVKKGKAAPSMEVGKMNMLVATRLENALIHVNDRDNPIGVTRNAGAAVKDKAASWHTEAGRAKLFEEKYPLAWGSKPVVVDAFLTGTVEISPDYRDTKIIVKVFDKKNLSLRMVGAPISIKTDRDALREMGHGFVIAKRSLNTDATKSLRSDSDVDEEAIKGLPKDDPMETKPDDPMGMKPTLANEIAKIREYLDFQILVDDAPAAITTDDEGRNVIDTPTPEQKVMIKVSAKSKLGLLVRVNGINTINKEGAERDRMESSWWVLEPGKEYPIRGFYKDGNVYPFKVVAESEVDKSELATDPNRHGVISFEIFDVGGSPSGKGEAKIVARKTSNLLKVTGRSTTLAGLQNNISNSLHKIGKRSSFIVPGMGTDSTLETDNFTGIFIGGCDIHYRPK